MTHSRRAAALTAATTVLLLSGCTSSTPRTDTPGDATAMGHIHGIGVDPADGSLYAATHFGLFRIHKGHGTRVADRWQDTMAFTVVGSLHFLGSGHPDPREDLPVHLGLIESTDAGRTWDELALQGEADFHALESTGDLIYAYDALTKSLMVTSDRRTFRTVTKIDAADLAADPGEPNRVLATTSRAGLVSINVATGRTQSLEAPQLAYVDWPRPELLVGLGPAGDIHLSRDGAGTWNAASGVPGAAAAVEITDNIWYAATSEGLFSSTNQARSWTPIQVETP